MRVSEVRYDRAGEWKKVRSAWSVERRREKLVQHTRDELWYVPRSETGRPTIAGLKDVYKKARDGRLGPSRRFATRVLRVRRFVCSVIRVKTQEG